MMYNIIRCTWLILLLSLITKSGNSQDYNIFQSSNAVMLHVKGGMHTETRLRRAVMALSNNTSELNVRLTLPYYSTNYKPADNVAFSSCGLAFNLIINVNPWQIQDDLTSAKTFVTHGLLTMNNTTKPVRVEYMALPAGTDQDGNFNLSMLIQFNSDDFNLKQEDKNSQFIIKISDAKVNML